MLDKGPPRGSGGEAGDPDGVWLSVRLSAYSLLYYSSIFFIKTSMFSASWAREDRFLHLDFKAALALAQTAGYLVGKGPSMAYSPKLERHQLPAALLAVIWGSGSMVLVMALGPPWLGVPAVAMACVFLAPSWSVLQRFIEGRSHTEAIVAVTSFAYIGVSGIVKTCGAQLLRWGLTERRMVACCVLGGVCVGSVSGLAVAAHPPPSAADVRRRGHRERITSVRAEGAMLFRRYGTGLGITMAAYVLCGALRAYRDYFQVELYSAAGINSSHTSVFALGEGVISALVLVTCAGFSRIHDNMRAMYSILATSAAGGVIIVVVTASWLAGSVAGVFWVVGVGCGTFLAYVPLGTMIFDRLLAAAGESLTSSLLQLVADTCVLVGTAALLCFFEREQGARVEPEGAALVDHGAFFSFIALGIGTSIFVLMIAAAVAFSRAIAQRRRVAKLQRERSGADDLDAMVDGDHGASFTSGVVLRPGTTLHSRRASEEMDYEANMEESRDGVARDGVREASSAARCTHTQSHLSS